MEYKTFETCSVAELIGLLLGATPQFPAV